MTKVQNLVVLSIEEQSKEFFKMIDASELCETLDEMMRAALDNDCFMPPHPKGETFWTIKQLKNLIVSLQKSNQHNEEVQGHRKSGQ
jgi:hypothetical protein